VPGEDLKKEAGRDPGYPKSGDYEVFDYPGGFDDLEMKDGSVASKKAEAERLAKLRIDAFESEHVIARALTPSRDVAAGLTFDFAGHDDRDGYLVTQAEYELEYGGYEADGGQARLQYSCRFEAVPKRTRFQPQPAGVRPVITGPQTATVVGPQGKEIFTDKHGRVKVQFHWDRVNRRNQDSSCFVRVSFPWASKGFGMVALPRIGDEVVVEFLEGNPDRPLITGAVYNGTNRPPYSLEEQATVSGIRSRSSEKGGASNFNELRFDDMKGKEYVWLQAEKDFKRLVKNDVADSIGNDHKLHIKNKSAVQIGADSSVQVGGDLTMEVGAASAVHLKDKLDMKVGKALALAVGEGGDIDLKQALKVTAAQEIHLKANVAINIEAGAKISLKVGASFIVIDASGVAIKGPIVMINSGGAAGTATAAKAANPVEPKDLDVTAKPFKDPLDANGKKQK